MIRPYEIAIAFRYLRSKARNRFVSFISLISVAGIAVAVAVLIAVLSAMNGFEYEVRDRILGVLAHGTVTGLDGRIGDWRELEAIAAADPEVVATAPFVRGEAMLVGASAIKGVEVRGIDPAAELATTSVAQILREGDFGALHAGGYRVVIGRALARTLDVSLGDGVILLVPEGMATPAGVVPRMRRFEVVGIFDAGMYEYDGSLAFIHRADAARLFRFGEAVSGVRFAFTDPNLAPEAVVRVARAYGGGVYVSDWTREHQNFFRSIQLTRSIMFVILMLVVGVAAFNIVSTLVMVVREKRAETAILRTLGASPSSIVGIFMSQGAAIGLLGTVIGVAAGVALAVNLDVIVGALEGAMGIKFLAPDIYFISDFPTRLMWSDVAIIAMITLALTLASTIYPAWRGAAQAPAEALRYH
ncbi:MAG: lipoprotein-releasing ABC transporter permease subunit [Gammaproteobacteria bacterium]|nr:lipoprotein-releasing ABC transporter permease subunit [Gammaproteobacteria bacterium]